MHVLFFTDMTVKYIFKLSNENRNVQTDFNTFFFHGNKPHLMLEFISISTSFFYWFLFSIKCNNDVDQKLAFFLL